MVMPNGRVSTSMEEPFYITAVPDPSVPKPSDEDLPKVNFSSMYKENTFSDIIGLPCILLLSYFTANYLRSGK